MLNKVKLALQISSNVFDTELNALINAAKIDLNIAGVVLPTVMDDIVERAIISYCSYQFELTHGNLTRADRMKIAYDEQKAQLGTATGYTDWS